VHEGTNVFKVFGQFTGSTNNSGIHQDVAAAAGQIFTAGVWANTPNNDQIAGANAAWAEVTFRDASANVLAMYRTAQITAGTPAGGWLNLAVTNQVNPATEALIGSVTNLVAPLNTSFVRYQLFFRQPANAAGSVLFDDLRLSPGGPSESPVMSSISRSGTNLNLAFPTYLNLPYVVAWKSDLTVPDWAVLTNLAGDGAVKSLTVNSQANARFYKVVRLCN
jgi:hypothetical protein